MGWIKYSNVKSKLKIYQKRSKLFKNIGMGKNLSSHDIKTKNLKLQNINSAIIAQKQP